MTTGQRDTGHLGLNTIGRERTGRESHYPYEGLSSVTRQLRISAHFLKMLLPSDRAVGWNPNPLPHKLLGKIQVHSVTFCLFFIPKGLLLPHHENAIQSTPQSYQNSIIPELFHSKNLHPIGRPRGNSIASTCKNNRKEQNKTKREKKKSSFFQETCTNSLYQKKKKVREKRGDQIE